MSRLISRIKHRQFGVLVMKAFVAAEAYQIVREDKHPVAPSLARFPNLLKRMSFVAPPLQQECLALDALIDRRRIEQVTDLVGSM